MNTMQLRTRLTLLMLIIAVPIVTAVVIFVSVQAGRLIEEKTLEDLHETNHALESSVSQWLGSYTVTLKQLTALPDIVSMDAERQKPVLSATASADPSLFLVQTVGLNGLNVARNDFSELRDYSDRQWYLGARAGNPITTQVLISRTTGNPALNMSMPIRNAQGEIIGVVSIVSELDEVAAAVHASVVGKTGYAYVVDEIGHVVAHPDPVFSEELRDLSEYPPVVFLQTNSHGQIRFTDEQGIRWVADVGRMENGWGIIVQQQETELLGPLRYFRFVSGTLSFVGTFLLLAVASWMIHRALRPIEMLTNTALAITNGDINRIAPVERQDEVGTLASAFNSMTLRTRELILSLEQRVNQLNETQVALKTSLRRQAAILDNIPDLAWLKDEQSRFIAVNEPFGRACGLAPADLIGKNDLDIWPEELAQGYQKDDFEVMRSGLRKHVEERLVDRTGRERWIETVKTPILAAGGELIGTAGIARDITERKQIEDALQESELRYRAIVEGTTDLICRFLPDTTLTFVNEAYCRYFGKSRDELVGTRFLMLIPENDWSAVQEHVNTVMRNKEPVTYSHEVITLGGELRWQQWTDSTIENEGGEIVELQSVGRDITEQTLADKSLKESERRFRVMFESVGLAGVMLDEKGRITFINDFLLRITNWSREDVLGEDWFDRFLPLEIREVVRTAFNQSRWDEPFIPHYENEILTRLGEKRLIRWNNTGLYDSIGNFTGTASIGEDITESRQAQEAIRSSEERYRLLFASNPHPMWVYDMDTLAFLAVNDAAIEKYGYSQDEFFQLTIKDIRPRDDIPRLLDNIKHVNTGLDSAGYWRHIKKDGELIDVEITSHPFLFEGHPAELVLANDVTQRKRIEDEREKLLRELEAKNIEAETLRDSAAAVALSLDLGETALGILDQLQRVVPYNSASVHLLLGNELQIVAGRGFPDGKDPTGMRFLLDQNDPAYPILNDGSPYILYSNVQEVSDRFIDYFHQHIFSWIAVPLHARGRLIGILTVDGFTTGKFSEDHARFASTFANQVAVTLENSRLYTDLQKELGERQKAEKELRQREVILDAVATSAELLLKTSDWKVVINEILEKLGWTIKASHAYLFEAHPGPEGEPLLSIRHEWSAPSFVSDLDNSLYQNMPLHEPGLERWHESVVLRNQPFVGDVVKSSQLEMKILNERAIKAIIDMPIVVNEKWWGVIGFDDMLNDREWTNVEIDALKVAANVLSSAIQRQLYDIALMDELHERQKLIEELEHKNAELERFTYTVSHDLKSPLVTIKGFLGYIQQDVASGNIERLNNDLERIGNATKKMEKLLRDLLELSRIGRLVKPPEGVSFHDLVREASEIVHGQLVAHGVTVRVQPDLPTVYGDRQRLVEVLQNLLDNAAKYMGNQVDPLIEIGLRGMEDRKFIFHVRDNGIGIVPQYHERVFGLFNKLDAHSEGTGVGLALVKRIIEFHGGRIWIESEGNSRGTTICFTLQAPPGTATGDGTEENYADQRD